MGEGAALGGAALGGGTGMTAPRGACPPPWRISGAHLHSETTLSLWVQAKCPIVLRALCETPTWAPSIQTARGAAGSQPQAESLP